MVEAGVPFPMEFQHVDDIAHQLDFEAIIGRTNIDRLDEPAKDLCGFSFRIFGIQGLVQALNFAAV
jgi:hypothetical protein